MPSPSSVGHSFGLNPYRVVPPMIHVFNRVLLYLLLEFLFWFEVVEVFTKVLGKFLEIRRF